jgi:hypothetical protein
MKVKERQEFVAGDRVVFQYGRGTVLRGTIEGWTDKYTAYMLHCDTGRRLLIPPAYLRREPAADPVLRQEREKHWPSYVVYITTPAGTQRIWSGKARTPRLAFARAGQSAPVLLDIVECKHYKRLNAKRKYPLGEHGARAYCEKVEEAPAQLFRLPAPLPESGQQSLWAESSVL